MPLAPFAWARQNVWQLVNDRKHNNLAIWQNAFRCIWTGLLLALAPLSAKAECSKSFSLGMLAFPPYIDFDTSGTAHGLDVDILKGAMDLAGCTFTLHEVPFKRALRDVKLGDLDGMPSVSRTAEREEGTYFTKAMRREVVGGFVRNSDTKASAVQSLEALVASDLKVGVVLGGWYGANFDDALEHNPAFHARVQASGDFLTLFRWLNAGIVDVAIVDILSGYHVSKKAGLEAQIKPLPFRINVNDLHLMLSRETTTATDLAVIDAALKAYRESAHYKALIRRYGPESLTHDLAAGQD